MQIRPANLDDVQKILELDRELFPTPWNMRNTPNWYWKYWNGNPAGQSPIQLMMNGDDLISHFAVVPLRLDYYGQTILGSHSIAMMVKPEFQSRGVIKFVADKLFADCKEKGIHFSYGYPNDLSYELHKKFLNYQDVTMMSEFYLNMDQSTEVPKTSNFQFEEIGQFDESVDQLWDETKEHFKIAVRRDHQFLNWRYLARPDHKYFAFAAKKQGELKGYVITKLFQDSPETIKGHIMDIVAKDNDQRIYQDLLSNCIEHFKPYGVNQITTWLHGHKKCLEVFQEFGFQKFDHERPLICRINIPNVVDKIHEGEDWLFTMGDSTEIY